MFLLPSLKRFSPLRDRVSKYTTTANEVHVHKSRTGLKYRTWSDLGMREALGAVHQKGMDITKAAIVYGIPRTTLSDHVHGRVLPGVKSGAPTLLSSREEEELVEFLCQCADIGYPKSRSEVMNIVNRMLSQKGVDRAVTNGWWTKFIGRHHETLSLRTPATLSVSRASASSRESIDNYFDILEDMLAKTGLSQYPGLIYNMDESGFPLDPKPVKAVRCRGSKNPYQVSSGNKTQVSIAACVSAAGQTLPPFIIWKGKTMSPEMAIGELPGTEYALSDSGWMNSTLFASWFRKVFLRYAPASRPIILLMDGHSSHYSPDVIKLAAENEVILFTLPPNTTHLTQPLDKGVFGPFKSNWRLVCHDYQVSHLGEKITKYNFVQLFSKAWIESMTAANIAAGFEITGIYPPNREAVRLPGEVKVHKKIVPNLTFSPAKLYTCTGAERHDGIFTTSELPVMSSPTLASLPTPDSQAVSSPAFDLLEPPRALRNIASLPLKTVPLYTAEDRIISSHPSVGGKQGKAQAAKGDKTCKLLMHVHVHYRVVVVHY